MAIFSSFHTFAPYVLKVFAHFNFNLNFTIICYKTFYLKIEFDNSTLLKLYKSI